MKTTRNRKGGALVTVMIVMMVMALAAGSMGMIAAQRAFTAQRMTHQARALAVAEAGANQAYALLSTNFAARYDASAFPVTQYGDGAYDVEITPIGEKLAIITSTGKWGIAAATVVLDVRNYGRGNGGVNLDWPSTLTNFAVVSGGEFNFNGCGSVTTSNGAALLHSNSKINVNGDAQAALDMESSGLMSIGNNCHIDGDLSAPEFNVKAHVTLDGEKTVQAVPFVEIPQVDLTPYYNIASENNQVKTAPATAEGLVVNASTNILGGILWVNGNVTVSSHPLIRGTIIATGTINFSGEADIDASQYGFALVSRDGSIKNTSTGRIRGLIYAKTGNYEQTANGLLIGQIIAAGSVKKGGCSDVIVVDATVPPDPNPDPWDISGDYPVISAWQK